MVAVVLVVSIGVFSLTALLPGDPVAVILGNAAADPAVYDQVRHELGFDKPFLERYVDWLASAFHGDLGRSYINHQPVGDTIRQALPPTIELLVLSEIFALLIAVVFAVASVLREGRLLDKLLTFVTFGFISIPPFIGGIVAIFVFAVTLRWLPATGFTPLDVSVTENLRAMVLPALVLGTYSAAVYTRVLRNDLLTSVREDFFLMAQAKGEPVWRLMIVHALRPSSLTLVTAIGLNIGALLGGAVIVETIFGIPGVGHLLIQSIGTRDYLVAQAVLLVISIGYVVVNFAVDTVYLLLDPRIRTT